MFLDENNKAFKEGKSNFEEQLYPWSWENETEFVNDHTGLLNEHINERFMPKTTLTPEERKELQKFYDSIDDRSLPSSYNARTKGIFLST